MFRTGSYPVTQVRCVIRGAHYKLRFHPIDPLNALEPEIRKWRSKNKDHSPLPDIDVLKYSS